ESKGAIAVYYSSAAFRFEVPRRVRGRRGRNFKSAALMGSFSFRLIAKDDNARSGEIETPHGRVRTPAFMPVGTQATVKGMYPDQVRDTGTDIVLANTYHLMLRPGPERIAALRGLHRF